MLSEAESGMEQSIGPNLVTRHFRTPEDLFGMAQGDIPRSDKLIGAAVQWAERMMDRVDVMCSTKRTPI